MDYAKTILFNRQDLLRALRRRLSERLKPYEDALNLLFADLFRGRLPVDWRERWRTFVAEQAALGYVTEPWSVRDMERFIFEWARFCELLPVEEMRMAYAPADQTRAAMRQAGKNKEATQPQRDSRESEFDRQLAEAAGAINEISTILESLALKIDYAPINDPKEVHAEVDRIDALIRRYNEALERAREVWLRERLSSAAYQRLLTLKGPLHLGLPSFTVDAQRQRTVEQQRRIFTRLGQGSQTLPETPPLSPEDAAECLVCTTLGGGVEIAAYQREGKWRVCKLLSLSSGQLTPEERRIFQMPAPTSYHGVKLAAVVASFILTRKGLASLIERTVNPDHFKYVQTPAEITPTGRRGDQTEFANSIEEIVSEELGIPLNERGPHEQRLPGRGPGGYRVPDFKFKGFEGSLRLRGTIVEVKFSSDGKFGSLSKRSRDQLLDLVARVRRTHNKASLVRSTSYKKILLDTRVELFTNIARPTKGKFANLIDEGLLQWRPLPSTNIVATPEVPHANPTVGKPGLGTAQSVALGILVAIVEAGVADSFYRDSARAHAGFTRPDSRERRG